MAASEDAMLLQNGSVADGAHVTTNPWIMHILIKTLGIKIRGPVLVTFGEK